MKLYLLLFLLLIPFAAASQIDKPIAHFDNCFSLNFSVHQISGNRTPFSFVGCSNPSFNQWSCMCLNDSYDLVLRSENDYSERIFELNLNYSLYNLDSFSQDLIVLDHSNWAEANGDSLLNMNDAWCTPLFKTVYITKYEDRNISINISIPIYVDRILNYTFNQSFVQNYSYWFENTSVINDLADKNFILDDNLKISYFEKNTLFLCLILISIVSIIPYFKGSSLR